LETVKLASLVEALLFAQGNSISIDKLCEIFEVGKKELKAAVALLKEKYDKEDSGIELVELENNLQLATKAFAYDYLTKLVKNAPRYVLSDSVLETLSIVAYKQPVTRAEIEKIRGVSCDHAINKLLEYELIEEVGRLDAPGKPLLFGTTEQFLRSFGVKSLTDLPQMNPEIIEEFKEQAASEATEIKEDSMNSDINVDI
jgi:segregation and condensation protein B